MLVQDEDPRLSYEDVTACRTNGCDAGAPVTSDTRGMTGVRSERFPVFVYACTLYFFVFKIIYYVQKERLFEEKERFL